MPVLRLSQILEGRKQQCGGSTRALHRAILAANGTHKGVEQRQLERLIKGEVVSVKTRDLEMIDVYLAQTGGPTLADTPFFEPEGVLPALVQNEAVHFFMSVRIHAGERRQYMSAFDVRAFSALLTKIEKRRPGTRVRLHEDASLHRNGNPRLEDFEPLFEEHKMSYCCIGSPRVSGLSEYMLGQMFGVTPFEPRPTFPQKDSPFHFVFSLDADGNGQPRHASRFTLAPDDIGAGEDAPARQAHEAVAFVAEGDPLLVHPDGSPADSAETQRDFGVVVAQHRPNDQFWVVIAGLSGPGTWAAAELVDEISLSVPEGDGERPGPPVFAVIEANVQMSPANPEEAERLGDLREVTSKKIIRGPKVWPIGSA